MIRTLAILLTFAALASTACGNTKNENNTDDTAADTIADTVPALLEQPNLRDAMGLQGPVHYIGVFDDGADSEGQYDTYEFDRNGHLVSIASWETHEAAFGDTIFYGIDGLPTSSKHVFIDYWTTPDPANPDKYPVTISNYKIKRETEGDYIKLIKAFESQTLDDKPVATSQIDENEYKDVLLARVKLDTLGRIVEVEKMMYDGSKTFNYTYDEDSNLAKGKKGKLAIPQADIMGVKHFDYECLRGQGATGKKSLTRGNCEFDITNFK